MVRNAGHTFSHSSPSACVKKYSQLYCCQDPKILVKLVFTLFLGLFMALTTSIHPTVQALESPVFGCREPSSSNDINVK